jgi:Flp pilus assembly protein TadD
MRAADLPRAALTYKATPHLHLLAAKRAINRREFDLARKHLAEVIKQNDRMVEAHNLLGVLFEMNQEYDTARKCYGRAIAIDSSYEPPSRTCDDSSSSFNSEIEQGTLPSRK